MSEKQYYATVRKWLEDQGYYCGGNITNGKGEDIVFQDIGTKCRRADVAGVKNVGTKFEDDIEVAAIEVRDRNLVSEADMNDAARYSHCVHKCYLATTASITDSAIHYAELRNLGLLQIGKGKELTVLHAPNPVEPDNYTEMTAFLESLNVIKCSICGCFFERFVRRSVSYESYYELIRAPYFKTVTNSEVKLDPLELKDIRKLPPEFKIYRYICRPCLEELFLNPKRIARIRQTKEEMEKSDACWSRDDEGFLCLVEQSCENQIYETIEIVEHLQKKHKIKPDDQRIRGWKEEHQKIWEKHLKKTSRAK